MAPKPVRWLGNARGLVRAFPPKRRDGMRIWRGPGSRSWSGDAPAT